MTAYRFLAFKNEGPVWNLTRYNIALKTIFAVFEF